MNIQTSSNVPDDTYFRTGEAEPSVTADGIVIYHGSGRSRSWGRPGVTSTVVLNEDDFAAIHVGFYHKHGGSQFWRYYMADGQTVRQVTWAQLPDDLRQRVLGAAQERAPSWAHVPGKLRAERQKPAQRAQRAYKLVEVREGGRLFSLYDPDLEYRPGVRLAEKARPDHRGGYYAHPTADQVLLLWQQGTLVPEACYAGAKTLALLEVEIAGTIVKYPNGKLAATYLTPLSVVDMFQYAPNAVEV